MILPEGFTLKSQTGAAPASFTFPSEDERVAYTVSAARERGIDPNVALQVRSHEGANAWQSSVVKNGKREPSYGDFQLYKGGGLGNEFQQRTGLDPADPKNWKQSIDFALDTAKQKGWGQWYGARAAGVTGFDGIGGRQAAMRLGPSDNQQSSNTLKLPPGFTVKPKTQQIAPPQLPQGGGVQEQFGINPPVPTQAEMLAPDPDQPPAPSGPSAPLSGWSPSQVAELRTRQVPPAQSFGDKVAGAFTQANNDPTGALGGAAEKIAATLGMNPAMAARLGRDVRDVPAAMGPLGAMELQGSALPNAKPIPPRLAPAPQIAEDAAKIGVQLPNAVVGGDLKQSVAQRLSDLPFVGTPLRNQSGTAIDQLGKAATTAERGYGSGSAPSAGEAMREGVQTHIRGVSKDAVSAEYDKALGMMDTSVQVPLTKTSQVAEAINTRNSNAALGESGAVKFVRDALNRTGMNYNGIKDLRTRIGEMVDTGVLPADMSGAELKQIYGALTEDLGTAVKASGNNDAFVQWQKANNLAAVTARNNEKLATVLGAKNDEAIVDRIGAAASSSSRADIKLLALARRAVDPKTWDELASAALAKMGRDREGNFSPDRFLTGWGKLSPAGKKLLFRSTGKDNLADTFDTIARVSSKFAQMNRMRNTSNTASAGWVGGLLATAWLNPLLALKTVVGGRVLAHMLASPARAKKVSGFMVQLEKAFATGNKEAFKGATISFARAIAAETNTPQLIPRIAKELQGTQPSYADQQQGN